MFFDKAVIFTDIHFGMKNNSRHHNQDCEDFITWMIDEAHKRGIKKCFFLGDWHHNRASINVSTLNYTTSNLRKLNDSFDEVIMITGNHDLYYREKREIHSLSMIQDFPKIRMINESMFIEDGIAFIPWLCDDEWKKLKEIDCKYMFGHFELPFFKMNAMIEMPNHGGIQASMLDKPDYVFTGHFHKRQYNSNIHYIGNAFPHNYADAQDNDRGYMFLEWDKEPIFVNWPECPKYVTCGLVELIDDPAKFLDATTYARIKLDVDISYEEASFIKENFMDKYKCREIQLVPVKEVEEEYEAGEIHFESVEQIVVSQLQTIESNTIDTDKLINIYQNL